MSTDFWNTEDTGSTLDDSLRCDLDALVDGSLSEPRRVALLSRLDSAPQGWRQCALAFLEAQAWRAAFTAFDNHADAAEIPPAASTAGPLGIVSLPTPRTVSRSRILRAAAALLVFGAGWLAGRLPMRSDAPLTAQSASPAGAPSVVSPSMGRDTIQRPGDHAAASAATVADSDPSSRPQPRTASSVVPSPLRDRLLREGYRVREDRALTYIALDDGTRVAVPVSQVRVQFVGGTIY